jgi:Undecaprenyl-phosphate galactose phosphotransferase WbaP
LSSMGTLSQPFGHVRVLACQVALDAVLLGLCLVFAWWVRQTFLPLEPLPHDASLWQGLLAPIALMPIGFWLAHLYPGYGLRGVERMRRRMLVVAAAAIFAIVLDYLILHGRWSRGTLVIAFTTALLVIPIADALLREVLVSLGWWGMPVVIVGNGTKADQLRRDLEDHPHLGYRPALMLDLSGKPAQSGGALPIVTTTAAVRSTLGGHAIAIVSDASSRRHLGNDLNQLPFYRIILVPDLLGLQTLWVDVRDLGGTLGLEVRQNLLLRRNRMIKAVMDRVLVVPFLLVAAPIIAVFAALVKLSDRGPAFYSQQREGQNGRPVRVWKLRSMYVNSQAMLDAHLAADPAAKAEWDAYCKLRNDPRILPWVGSLIRSTSIDELPQLWNVMTGELSLVGPRPFPYYHLEKFSGEFRAFRCSVMPGITGLWQVSDRSDADLPRQEELDSYYIRNWSPWMDLQLLARTVWVLLFRRSGAR